MARTLDMLGIECMIQVKGFLFLLYLTSSNSKELIFQLLERNFTAQTPDKVWVSDYHVLGHPHGLAVFDGDHRSISGYIEVFYNQHRRHSTLGYLCPAEYEKQKLKLCA